LAIAGSMIKSAIRHYRDWVDMLRSKSAVGLLVRGLILFAVLSALTTSVRAQSAAQLSSPWFQSQRATVRLLAGERLASGTYRAALEIKLDNGFKTYWRSPGDSGLPPVFDWSASKNVADVAIAWPYPERMADLAGSANIYHDRVVFPLIVRPAQPDAPVALSLKLNFGVCSIICIPASADVDLSLPVDGSGLYARSISAALARVPAPTALGAAGDFAILSAVPERDMAGKPVLKVLVRTPGPAVELFAEGPDPWLFGVPRVVQSIGGQGSIAGQGSIEGKSVDADKLTLHVPVADAPAHDASSASNQTVPVLLTLVFKERAIETLIVLDAASLRP
jgi:DsbC/DsbD-like thiol-disulfide interchange protein